MFVFGDWIFNPCAEMFEALQRRLGGIRMAKKKAAICEQLERCQIEFSPMDDCGDYSGIPPVCQEPAVARWSWDDGSSWLYVCDGHGEEIAIEERARCDKEDCGV
jgi:hypothetical protein